MQFAGLRWLAVLLLVLTLAPAQAATCTSKASGNWGNPSSWVGCGVPAAGDAVVINAHTVTVDQNTNAIATLTINTGGILDSNAGMTITTTGNITINGTLQARSSGNALTVNAGGNLALGAGSKLSSNTSGQVTVVGNMTTNATSTVDLANSSVSLAITGNLTNNATAVDACAEYGTGAFNFGNGTGTLSVNGNLTNNASACIKLGDNIPSGISGLKVSGTTNNTGHIFAHTSGAVLEFVGNLRNQSSGLITSTWNTSVVLRRDYRNDNASFVPSNNWIFRGSVAQSITTSATTFNFIEIDNAAGVTLSGGNLTVGVDTNNWTQRLKLTNGKLNTGSYKVILSKSCDSNTLTRSNGWVNGNLTYNTMPQWAYECVFPVGDASNYAPVAIYPDWQPPASGILTVRTDAGDHADVSAGITGLNPALGVNRTWTLTPGSPALDYSANQYRATFQFCNGISAPSCTVSDVDSGADPNLFVVAQKVGSIWSLPTVGTRSSTSTQATGLASFGIFALAGPYAPKLLLDYRFDECAQYSNAVGQVRDTNGALPGTPMGGLQNLETGGKLGRHADFTKGQTYVNVPGGPFLFNWTVSAWFKKPFASSPDHPGRYYTFGSVAGGGDFFSLDRTNGYKWGVWTTAASDSAGAGGVTWGSYQFSGLADGWHHVVAVGSGNTTTLYVDGVQQDSVTRKVKGFLQYVGSSFDGVGDPTQGQSFGTPLDEFKVFNYALDASAIASLYNNESAGQDWNTGTPRGTVNCTIKCVVDDFASGALNGALWNAAKVSGTFTPAVVPVGAQQRIRLTEAVAYQSTMLQLKKWFPGAGNKITVEFDYYVYGGNGADGIAVVFSDAAVTPAPGGFGGSLGYAQRSGINGFAGGWLAVGIDEFGNFPTTSEGRSGYPSGYTAPTGANVASGFYKNSIAVRGSGSGTTGYALLANTGTLSPVLWNNSNTSNSLQKFRITIDHSNSTNAFVTVERDAGGGGIYTTVVPTFDAKAAASQAAVPTNWLVSFAGSTGGNHNFHEIANLSICATNMTDPGGSVVASNFECMDASLPEASYVNRQTTPSGRNPIYTKLARTAFKLRVVPIKADGSVEVSAPYSDTRVEVFDVSSGTESACSALSVGSRIGGPVTIDFLRSSNDITVNPAVQKARCRVTYTNPSNGSVVQGCASDLFAVRPGAVTLATTATAAAPSASAMPAVKAGANFTLRATTSTNGSDAYSGTLTQNSGVLTAQVTTQDATQVSGGALGALSPASLVANAAAVNATYGEVGYLYLGAGAYRDTTFTAVDQNGDCVAGSTSVTLSGSKYGCVIGTTAAVSLGRFIPDHFDITPGSPTPACGTFTYFGQDGFSTEFILTAKNAGGTTTQNYQGVFGKLDPANWSSHVFSTQAALPVGATLSASATATTGSWAAGVASVLAKHQISRPSVPIGETDVTVMAKPQDSDNVSTIIATAVATSNAKLRFGRLRLSNTYVSAPPLKIPVQAQYWSGLSWVNNGADSCTPLVTGNVKLSNEAPAGWTAVAPGTLNSGSGFITLTPPASARSGSLTLCVDLASDNGFVCSSTVANLPWLQSKWPEGSGFNNDPSAQATFGIFSPEGKKGVFNREIY